MGSLHGGILSLDSLHGTPVAKGMFYPKALRCARGTGRCFAVDMSKQYSAMSGGRDKLLTFQTGDDFGYACCASANVPYTDVTPTPDCSGVAKELKSTGVDERPSGLDFSPASWGTTFGNGTLIAIHGTTGNGVGARIVLVRPDAMSGLPTGPAIDFATGWDDATLSHGQPADVTFRPDGRMY